MSEIDTSTAAIEALMDGVTPGPWEQDGPISSKIVWAGPDVRVCFMTSDGPASKNARFIAASRALVPALTDERDAAVARVAELEAEVERMRQERDDIAISQHLTTLAVLNVTYHAEGYAAGWTAAIEAAALWVDGEWLGQSPYDAARLIRAIPMPTDAASALSHLIAQARAQGMREAAFEFDDDMTVVQARARILARAEEIENEAAGIARPLAEQAPAWLDVIAERCRQVSAEGWTPEHDDQYDRGELSAAAACYAYFGWVKPSNGWAPTEWPWASEWWKPTTPRRDLVKAAALILAEIERLDRAEEIETEARNG